MVALAIVTMGKRAVLNVTASCLRNRLADPGEDQPIEAELGKWRGQVWGFLNQLGRGVSSASAL